MFDCSIQDELDALIVIKKLQKFRQNHFFLRVAFRSRLMFSSLIFCLLVLSQKASAQPVNAVPAGSESQSATNISPDETKTVPVSEGDAPTATSLATETMIPDYFLASVAIDAVVAGERVNLEASIEVVVNRDVGWIQVPLRFDQAHIWSREYQGPGEEAPNVGLSPNGEGISWLLKGKGKHLLKFSMWAPYRKSIIGSRLQLTLPPLSDQFDTKLNLTVPDARAVLRSGPNLDILRVERGDDQTTFETSISKNRLDLIWSVPRATARKVSKVLTQFHLKPNSESVSLIADQAIELQQQDSQEIIVRLPEEFELITQEVNQNPVTELSNRPGWVSVQLGENTSSTVQLHWEFSRPLNKSGERVMINGLEVEAAAQQGGTIQIDGLQDYRIIPRLSESRLVYRIGNPEQSMTLSELSNSTFEFLQQPFNMALDFLPIEPLHSTTLLHALRMEPNQLVLEVHQLITVERGSLSSFDLIWPNFEQEGWQFKRASSPALSLGALSTSVAESGSRITINTAEPVESSQYIHLVSQFIKPFSFEGSSDLKWSLPYVLPESARGELLSLDLSDSIEFAFDDLLIEEFSLGISSGHLDQLSELWQFPEEFTERLKTGETYSLNHLTTQSSPSKKLSGTIEQHTREVVVETTLEILEATPRDLLLNQKFELDIRYGRINSLELVFPDSLKKIMEPVGVESGISVTFEGEPLTVNSIAGIPRLTFPNGIIGKRSFEIEYRLPKSMGNNQQNIQVPLIDLNQEVISRVFCRITPVENVQISQVLDQWDAAKTSPLGPLWVRKKSSSPMDSIELLIGGGLTDTSQQYLIDKAHYWTQFEEDGRAKTFARFEILSPPSRLIMTVPENSEFIVDVDGTRLSDESITRSLEQSSEVVLNLPDQLDDLRILEIQYLTESPSSFSLAARRKFEFPQFAKSVWVNETLWEMQLPFGFHLFEYPDLKPLFSWVRRGVVWQREPVTSYQMQRSAEQDLLPDSFRFTENFYGFRGFSPVSVVEFRAMNRSMILLIGAGLALSMGFVFYRFPVTRNVFSLVVLAFCFAVVSVWYLEPMLLLLQPAVIGILLALTATLIDVRSRRSKSEIYGKSSRTSNSSDSLSGSQQGLAEGTTRIYQPSTTSGSDVSRG